MTDTWSERAEAYRHSDAHSQGRDLELFAEWAEGEKALDQTGIEHPIVVRFDGTNAAEGRQILEDAGRDYIHVEATMLEAARRAVELAHD